MPNRSNIVAVVGPKLGLIVVQISTGSWFEKSFLSPATANLRAPK